MYATTWNRRRTLAHKHYQVGVGATATNLVPSFGWLESFDDGNQHGALPNGLLVATSGSNWYGYDPDTGVLTRMNITNVPSGTSVQGPKGSILRYVLDQLRNQTLQTGMYKNGTQLN